MDKIFFKLQCRHYNQGGLKGTSYERNGFARSHEREIGHLTVGIK